MQLHQSLLGCSKERLPACQRASMVKSKGIQAKPGEALLLPSRLTWERCHVEPSSIHSSDEPSPGGIAHG